MCPFRPACWTASALVTTTAWANGGGSLAGFNNDYAFRGGRPWWQARKSTQLDAAVGDNAIAFNVTHPTRVYSFGYPQASPYNGQKLIHCAGQDVADTWGGTTDFRLNCNMTGGSSGGPWFVNFDSTSGTSTQLGEQLQVHRREAQQAHVRPVLRRLR